MSMMTNLPKVVTRRGTAGGPAKIEPTPPSLDDELTQKVSQVVDEVKQYAPTLHPDRVSATTKIMSEAIRKVFEDTAAGIDTRVTEFKAKVVDIEKGAEIFKSNMRAASEALIRQVEIAMAQYEDLTHKMQESPFGPLPQIVSKKSAEEPAEKVESANN